MWGWNDEIKEQWWNEKEGMQKGKKDGEKGKGMYEKSSKVRIKESRMKKI